MSAFASRVAAGCALATACFASMPARAEDPPPASSSYCHKVQARGDSDAALLMYPQVVVQGIRFPASNVDLTLVGRTQYQGRVGLAFSPVDLYRGVGTKDVAGADCAQHEVQAGIEELLSHLDDAGKLPALMGEAAYLDAHRDEWQAVLKKEDERFTARVVSLVELDDVRTRTTALERKSAQVHGEADRLRSRAAPRPAGTLGELESRYVARTDEYERRVAHVRSLAAWQLKVTGGVVPTDAPVDWYGIVELSFNLGAFEHNKEDSRYVAARRDEVKNARYELASRLHDLQAELEGVRTEARRELEVLDRQVAFLSGTRRALEGSEAPGTAHAVAALTLDQIALESDQTYLRGLVAELTAFLGDERGR